MMRPHLLAGVALVALLAAGPRPARATPLDFVTVGEPVEDEMRVLDVLGAGDSLPHLGMRPLQVAELPGLAEPAAGALGITRMRLRRAFARDRAVPDTAPGATPRLLQLSYPGEQRLEVSLALEGSGATVRGRAPDFTSPSGARMRLGVQIERWDLHADVTAGHLARGLEFAQSLLADNDAVLHSEEAYVGYTAASGLWAVQAGRSRWHWGPGDEAGLLLSKTSAPLTGMAFHLRVRPLRADGMVLWASIQEAAGQQFAAHRLEWQPFDGLRLGVSEAVRFRSPRWEPLYGVGVLPYTLAQQLLVQDEPDSAVALHNNVLAAVDVAWRVGPGQRLCAELMIDDLRTNDAPTVSKYGYLLGWEGVRSAAGRATWSVEYARLTRFVYTSALGSSFVAQDLPLGYPTGPDSRRLRVRAGWDPTISWQAFTVLEHTDAGESGLDTVFRPGDPRVEVTRFLGVVQHDTRLGLGLRWWPASGVDLAAMGQLRWVDNAGHVAGASRAEPGAELRVRIGR